MNKNRNILFTCVHIHSCRTQWMLKMKWNNIANLHFTLSLFLLLLKSKLLSRKCLYLRSMHLYCDLRYHRRLCTYYALNYFFWKYRKWLKYHFLIPTIATESIQNSHANAFFKFLISFCSVFYYIWLNELIMSSIFAQICEIDFSSSNEIEMVIVLKQRGYLFCLDVCSTR